MSVRAQLRKYARIYPQWGFVPPRAQLQRPLLKLGSDYGGYFVDEALIREAITSKDAVVYSVGIGEDVSFDLAMIERFGVKVEAFDPTPKVKNWLATQALPGRFRFHDTGIADFDGEARFYLPPRKDWISHSMVSARQYSPEFLHFPVIRLGTAMRQLGHECIDVLKMDIEGAEYAVIEDLVRERIPVRQLLVEFHHRLSSIKTDKTRQSIALLESCGMRLAYVCPRFELFTLVKAT